MHPRRGAGGISRPGRGDVDLEALQDVFLRSTEKPSAKVTRSKVGSLLADLNAIFQKSLDVELYVQRDAWPAGCPPKGVMCSIPAA